MTTTLDALSLLALIQPTLRPDESVESRYLLQGQPAIARFHATQRALVTDAERYRDVWNCYVGVNPRRGRDGTAAGVSRSGTCHADIDAKLFSGTTDPKAAALTAINSFPLRPGAVVDSGGGYQPYWPFTEAVDVQTSGNAARLEACNAALARAVCGPDRRPDHVQDVARILRLPGTLNHKPEYGEPRPVRLLRCEPDRRYDLTEIEVFLVAHYSWAMRPAEARVSVDQWVIRSVEMPPADLRERAARGRIRRATLDLLDSVGASGYQSPSEADAALAAGLVGAGLTDDEVFSLLLSSNRGDDALRRKGARHGENYLRRTVAHAASFVGPVIERLPGLRARLGGASRPALPMMEMDEAERWLS